MKINISLHSIGLELRAENRLRYVIDFLERHSCAPEGVKWYFNPSTPAENSVNIEYGINFQNKNLRDSFFVPQQNLFFIKNNISNKLLFANNYLFGNQTLFSVESQKNPTVNFIDSEAAQFQFDIFETIFFHISRYEEYFCSPKEYDEWDMMRSDRQFLCVYKIEKQAVVDILVYNFYHALGLQAQKTRTSFQMTHDIDGIRRWEKNGFFKLLRATAGAAIRRESLKSFIRIYQSFFKIKFGIKKDAWDTFDFLLIDAPIKKVIYFLTKKYHRFDAQDYAVSDDKILKIIELAKKKNYVVGLHPSYLSHENEGFWQSEKQEFESVLKIKPTHSRQHYLHFSMQKTPEILQINELENDSTLGYQDRIGFRCGTGIDYFLYNFEKETKYNFLETPMVVMDCALLKECNYDQILFAQILFDFLAQNYFFTKITFNFHNSIFDDSRTDGDALKETYLQLYSHLSKHSK